MAITSNGTTTKIECGSDTTIDNIWSGGGTLFVWLNPASDGELNAGRIFDKVGSGGWRFFTRDESASTMRVRLHHNFSTTAGRWDTISRDINNNTWESVGMDYDKDLTSNNPTIYIGGSSRSITESSTPVGTAADDSAETLVLFNRAGQDVTLDGSLSNAALWDEELTSNHQSAIANGIPPLVVSGNKPVFYMPMFGNDLSTIPDYIGQTSQGTGTATSKSSTNPPVELLENYI